MEPRHLLIVAAAAFSAGLPFVTCSECFHAFEDSATFGSTSLLLLQVHADIVTEDCHGDCYEGKHAGVPWHSSDISSYAKCRWKSCKGCHECVATEAQKKSSDQTGQAQRPSLSEAKYKMLADAAGSGNAAATQRLKEFTRSVLQAHGRTVVDEGGFDEFVLARTGRKAPPYNFFESALLSSPWQTPVARGGASAAHKTAVPKAAASSAAAALAKMGRKQRPALALQAVSRKPEEEEILEEVLKQTESMDDGEDSVKKPRAEDSVAAMPRRQHPEAWELPSKHAKEQKVGVCSKWCPKHKATWETKCSWMTNQCSACDDCKPAAVAARREHPSDSRQQATQHASTKAAAATRGEALSAGSSKSTFRSPAEAHGAKRNAAKPETAGQPPISFSEMANVMESAKVSASRSAGHRREWHIDLTNSDSRPKADVASTGMIEAPANRRLRLFSMTKPTVRRRGNRTADADQAKSSTGKTDSKTDLEHAFTELEQAIARNPATGSASTAEAPAAESVSPKADMAEAESLLREEDESATAKPNPLLVQYNSDDGTDARTDQDALTKLHHTATQGAQRLPETPRPFQAGMDSLVPKGEEEVAVEDETVNRRYHKAEAAADKIAQDTLQVQELAQSREGEISGAFQAIGKQVTRLKGRIKNIKDNFNKEFAREKTSLQAQLEAQIQNNTQYAEENKNLAARVEEMHKANDELRAHAEETRTMDERLQMALDSMKANLTLLQDYLSFSLDNLDDSEAPETEILRAMAVEDEQKEQEVLHRLQLREIDGRSKQPRAHSKRSKAKQAPVDEEEQALLQVGSSRSTGHRRDWHIDLTNSESKPKADVAFTGMIKTLQDTVLTLQKEHAERLKSLRELYTQRLEQQVEKYEELVAERAQLDELLAQAQQTHDRLDSASRHLQAAQGELERRLESLKGYAKHLSLSATPPPLPKPAKAHRSQ